MQYQNPELSTGPPLIEFHKVTKMFGAKTAVNQVSFDVRAGEIFAFLGPNGAGKTTSIKMICGLIKPTAGQVRICGFEAGSPEARSRIAYVPDQPFLYDKLTGREFLEFVTQMYGMSRDLAKSRIARYVELFEIDGFLDELCEGYSQGMKQRLVFASALVHEPSVLVVDEPFVGLDPRSARIVKRTFVEQAQKGVAILMSIHLLSIAEDLADRIGIINSGQIVASGTLAELKQSLAHDGNLEDLFLALTGGDDLTSSGDKSPDTLDEEGLP